MDIFFKIPIKAVKITATCSEINVTSFRVGSFCTGPEKNNFFYLMPAREGYDLPQDSLRNISVHAHRLRFILHP